MFSAQAEVLLKIIFLRASASKRDKNLKTDGQVFMRLLSLKVFGPFHFLLKSDKNYRHLTHVK